MIRKRHGVKMKLARIISIIMLLLQHKKITADRLAEMLEVSPRTIYRDLEVIGQAGIPVTTMAGKYGGVGIMEEYKVEKGLFTTADITSLLIGLGSIPLTSEEVRTTLAKIKGLIPKEQMLDIETKSRRIVVDHSPWYGRQPLQPGLAKIKKSLDENRRLSFHYYDSGGRESRRTIEPCQLLWKDSTWYLWAYCLSRQDFRLFRISRMSEVEMLEETFFLREGFECRPPDEPEPSALTITLLVDESLRGWAADLAGKENLEPRGNRKFLARIPFVESDYGYGLLLCFGDKCECLEPEPVRREVARRAAALLRQYQ